MFGLSGPPVPRRRASALPAVQHRWAYPAVTWVSKRALITYLSYTGGVSLQPRSVPVGWFHE